MRIEARGLGKRFGHTEALRDLRFEVPAGRRLALVGPNGSGKSTLNRVLAGLLNFSGEVRVDGCCPLRERAAIAQRIGYVPQVAPQSAASVRELVAAMCRLRRVKAAQIEKTAAALGLDLAATARTPFRSLSGGTRQKLLLALALAAPTSLLVLDEPTASLDSATRERFFELFAERAADCTLLLCSHRIEEIRPLVDHVLALAEGRLVFDGPVDAFLDARALSVVEVQASEAASAWLEERGFRRGASGWWMRSVRRGSKAALVEELSAALRGELRDLNVRELDAVELDDIGGGALDTDTELDGEPDA